MAKPDHPHEVRVRMALERALDLPAAERAEFLRWLRTADPELAAHVLVSLAHRDPDESGESAE